MPLPHPDFVLNVVVALVLGSLIGLERQYRQHAAGMRTNALVCAGAALFVSLSALTGDVNPTRVASYVVSGVGFLGGGVILRDGLNVRGVDTAATLWGSAAVGALTGCGFPLHGLIGAATVLTANMLLKRLSRRLDHRRLPVDVETAYRVRVVCDGEQTAALREALIQHIATVPKLVVHGVATRHAKRRRAEVLADLSSSERCDHTMEGLVVRLNAAPGVLAVSWEMVRHGAG